VNFSDTIEVVHRITKVYNNSIDNGLNRKENKTYHIKLKPKTDQ
jgi:hypothetical protein